MKRDKTTVATIMLLVATIFWACAFKWAKTGGDAVNEAAGLEDDALLGPIYLLAVRFIAAGALWLAIFPLARRGWTWASVKRSLILGGLLGAGIISQHLGLDRTSEALSAFLTSLTVVFVPLMMTVVLRRPPPAVTWLAVGLAATGIVLMTTTGAATDVDTGGIGLGVMLGLLCSLFYAVLIVATNELTPADSGWRLAGGQFLVAGLIAATVCLFVPLGPGGLGSDIQATILSHPDVWFNALLLIIFPTMIAFGAMMLFQPHLTATRAALIYMVEPVVAALYAGRALSTPALAGAGLILAANGIMELLSARARRRAIKARNED